MAEEDVARELREDARALVESGEWAKAVALLSSLHPADLADLVLALNEDEQKTQLTKQTESITKFTLRNRSVEKGKTRLNDFFKKVLPCEHIFSTPEKFLSLISFLRTS